MAWNDFLKAIGAAVNNNMNAAASSTGSVKSPAPAAQKPQAAAATPQTQPTTWGDFLKAIGAQTAQAASAKPTTPAAQPVQTQPERKPTAWESFLETIGAKKTEPATTQPEQSRETASKRREELVAELNEINSTIRTQSGKQREASSARAREINEELQQLDTALGNEFQYYEPGGRSRDFVSSWAKGRAAGDLAAAGSVARLGNQLQEDSSEEDRAINDSAYSGWATDEVTRGNMLQAGPESAGVLDENKEVAGWLWDNAKRLNEEQKMEGARAATGLSSLQQTAQNVIRAGLDLGADIVESQLTGGILGRARMYGGAYGQEAMEQEEKGGDVYQQNLAGLKAAGSAWLSEKLLGNAEKAYGKSAAGKAMDTWVKRFVAAHPALQSNVVQRAIRALTNTEGLEEAFEDVLNYAGDRLLGLDRESSLNWDEMKQDWLVGKILGLFTGGLDFDPVEFRQSIDETIAQAATGAIDPNSAGAESGPAAGALLPFSEHEAQNLLNDARNKVVGYGTSILDFVNNAVQTKGQGGRLYLGKLTQRTVDLVRQATGLDVSGFSAIMNSSEAWHAFCNHSDAEKESARGQVAVSAEDFELVPVILNEPDSVALGDELDGNGRPLIVFIKKIGNEYVALQGFSNKKKGLAFDSMWIKKSGASTTRSTVDQEVNQEPTSETKRGYGTANIVAPGSAAVNEMASPAETPQNAPGSPEGLGGEVYRKVHRNQPQGLLVR